MDGLPTSRRVDHLALFKEINEFVSFHELLEPLSPYSTDSDSDADSLSPEDDPSNLSSLFGAAKPRVKQRNRYLEGATLELRDPSNDKLFQMLAKGNRAKHRDPLALNQQNSTSSMSNTCSRVPIVNEDSTKRRDNGNSGKGGARTRNPKHQEQQNLLASPAMDFPSSPCASSSHQQQNAVQRSALVKFGSLHISDRGSYFNTLDKGLSKYPNYFDYVDNIKKPFKHLDDLPCGPSSGSNHDSMGDGSQFNCNIGPPTPDLSPDILSALNSCLSSFD